jgi:hypothetical protein
MLKGCELDSSDSAGLQNLLAAFRDDDIQVPEQQQIYLLLFKQILSASVIPLNF